VKGVKALHYLKLKNFLKLMLLIIIHTFIFILNTSYSMKRSFLKDFFEDGPKAKIFIIDLIQENPRIN